MFSKIMYIADDITEYDTIFTVDNIVQFSTISHLTQLLLLCVVTNFICSLLKLQFNAKLFPIAEKQRKYNSDFSK